MKTNGVVIEIFYPSCSDTTNGLARKFEKGHLVSETWFRDGRPFGPEFNYSDDKGNLLTQMSVWDKNDVPFSISYFEGTNKSKNVSHKIRDSVYYNIAYFRNGRIASHGLSTARGCRFGIWTEFDSLGVMKWTGKYKVVSKESHEKASGGDIILTWCFEKDSIWTKTDKSEKILEKTIFTDGKSKNYH